MDDGRIPPILTGCTKGVTCDKLPHASKELGQSTVEQGHADNNIWNGDVSRLHVVKGEYEGRRCKSKQSTTWVMSFQYNINEHAGGKRRTEEQGSQPGSGAAGARVSRCQTLVSLLRFKLFRKEWEARGNRTFGRKDARMEDRIL